MQHDLTKQKIIELIPDIFGVGSKRDGHRIISVPVQRKITLADVLRAIDKQNMVSSSNRHFQGKFALINATFENGYFKHDAYWNMTTDYEGQTQEVKEFIGKLLGV